MGTGHADHSRRLDWSAIAEVVGTRMPTPTKEIEDDTASAYSVGTNIDNNEARVRFYAPDGTPLSSMVFEGPDLYEFASRLLRAYDDLEGL
jgi:hypothetical protein